MKTETQLINNLEQVSTDNIDIFLRNKGWFIATATVHECSVDTDPFPTESNCIAKQGNVGLCGTHFVFPDNSIEDPDTFYLLKIDPVFGSAKYEHITHTAKVDVSGPVWNVQISQDKTYESPGELSKEIITLPLNISVNHDDNNNANLDETEIHRILHDNDNMGSMSVGEDALPFDKDIHSLDKDSNIFDYNGATSSITYTDHDLYEGSMLI